MLHNYHHVHIPNTPTQVHPICKPNRFKSVQSDSPRLPPSTDGWDEVLGASDDDGLLLGFAETLGDDDTLGAVVNKLSHFPVAALH